MAARNDMQEGSKVAVRLPGASPAFLCRSFGLRVPFAARRGEFGFLAALGMTTRWLKARYDNASL